MAEDITSLLQKFKSSKDLNIKLTAGYNLCALHLLAHNFEDARYWGFQSIKICEKLANYEDHISILHNIGISFALEENKEQARTYFSMALALATEHHFDLEIANSYLNIGASWYDEANYHQALENFILSIHIFEKIYTMDPELLHHLNGNKINLQNNIGLIYMKVGRYEDALQWFKKNLKIKTKINYEVSLANLGECYMLLNKPDYALDFFRKSVKVALKHKNFHRLYLNYYCLAMIYAKQNQPDQALELLHKSYTFFDEHHCLSDLLDCLESICIIYMEQQKHDLTQPYFEKGLKIVHQVHNSEIISHFYRAYSKYCFYLGKLEEAYFFLDQSYNLNTTIYNQNIVQNTTFFAAQFDAEQKTKDNMILKLKNLELKEFQKKVEQQNEELTKHIAAKDYILSLISSDITNYVDASFTANEQYTVKQYNVDEKKYIKITSESKGKAIIISLNKIDIIDV